ncbi:LLM class flavin-dependent oxidoreductase [Nakamurella endophytica]|uniref:LLM class flavin-dependent oxidoreductase n=1 Tax=Nakamurella endophytica TaxID=1748367 RepID=UPI00166B5D04
MTGTAAVAATATAGTVLPGQAQAAAAPSGVAAAAPDHCHRRRLGYVLSHEQFPTDALRSFASAADAAGFASVWASDHIQPWQPNEGHSMFPWNTLALVGRDTRHLHFGTGVTCPTYRHHPTQVAQAWASLGIENPGRVFLGVGTGEALNEQASTGAFGRYPERAARLVEAVTLIRRLWTGQRVTFQGRYFRTQGLKLWDLPRRPVPIHIAASGPKSAYLAGRYGDGWITGSADFLKKPLRDAFARGARAAGKDPDAMPKLVETFVVVGGQAEAEYAATRWRFTVDPWSDLVYVPDPARIQQLAAQRWPLSRVYRDWPVSTDPAVHIAAVRKLVGMGATPFIHSGQQDQKRVIDFYGRYVLPHV